MKTSPKGLKEKHNGTFTAVDTGQVANKRFPCKYFNQVDLYSVLE